MVGERVGRRESCPKCGADLHCCRNCRFYDPTVYNECRETQAERVVEKEKSNFCDYFELAEGGVAGRESTEVLTAKKRLAGLFKKG